jgi:hypothetical protein
MNLEYPMHGSHNHGRIRSRLAELSLTLYSGLFDFS